MRFQIERHLGHLAYEQARSRKLDRRSLTTAAVSALAPKRTAAAEFDPQDYVSFLLYIDAEIEHGLMVQYLYAAYSLGGSQVPEQYQEQIRSWQELIFGIAKEEMGHLISVQNVLRLIGAPLNFLRDDFPWDTPFYPFPFTLEPLTLPALAKYLFAESPADWSGKLADEVKKMVKFSTDNPHRVGELFDQLIAAVEDPDFLPDEVFQADTWPFQAKFDEWGRGYRAGARGDTSGTNPVGAPDLLIAAVASRDDTVDSLKSIAEQGEAPDVNQPDKPSHFARFHTIYKEMKALLPICQKEGWSPWRNVAVNPFIPPSDGSDPSEGLAVGQERDPITHPEAVKWGHLFNVRYRMLLNYLTHSFELKGGLNETGGRTPRGIVINGSFGEMYNLRAIATIMVQIPLAANHRNQGKTAGPPFEMPYTLNRPMGDANRWRQHKHVLKASEPLIAELLKISPLPRHKYLHALREADQQSLQIIDRILAGYTSPVL
jgi:hypothetical protein